MVIDKLKNFIKQRSIQTIFLISLYIIFSPYLSDNIHKALYAISVFIKDILIWFMPITVCFLIAHTISAFGKKAPLFILMLIILEAFFNFSSVWYSYFTGKIISESIPMVKFCQTQTNFAELWRIPLSKPAWLSADKGAFLGIILGLILSFTKSPLLHSFIRKGKNLVELVLTKFFAKLIPIFVLGLTARIYKTEIFDHVLKSYQLLIFSIFGITILYILILFLIAANFNFKTMARDIKNILPAGGIAFTSGCSLSTMPWTISCTSKNLRAPELAKAIIPATTNIQQIGDCIANSVFCYIIYKHFYGIEPSLIIWLQFSIIFVLARFATAAVLGGAIFIMLPIYETYLSFNAEMIAMILTLNIVLDPLITSSNVIANCAICKIYEKAWMKLLKKTVTTNES